MKYKDIISQSLYASTDWKNFLEIEFDFIIKKRALIFNLC